MHTVENNKVETPVTENKVETKESIPPVDNTVQPQISDNIVQEKSNENIAPSVENNKVETPVTENKVETKKTTPPVDNNVPTNKNNEMFSQTSKSTAKNYSIQLGAFANEINAREFTKKVINNFDIDISSYVISGLYKIRTGSYGQDEALEMVKKIRNTAFQCFYCGPDKINSIYTYI